LHTKVTYEAHFPKVYAVVCALRSFSRSWKYLQTKPCTDCILEIYASSTQAVQSSGSSFGSSCSSFRSHLEIYHCCEAVVAFTEITHHQKDGYQLVLSLIPGPGNEARANTCSKLVCYYLTRQGGVTPIDSITAATVLTFTLTFFHRAARRNTDYTALLSLM